MTLSLSSILFVLGFSFVSGGLMFLVGHGWLHPFFGMPPDPSDMIHNVGAYKGARTDKEKKYTFIAVGIGIVLFLLGTIAASFGD